MKKSLLNTGKHSSRTRSVERLIAGHGKTLPSKRPGLSEATINAMHAVVKMYQTKTKKLTTLIPSSTQCSVSKDGMSIHGDCWLIEGGGRCSAYDAMLLKQLEKTNKESYPVGSIIPYSGKPKGLKHDNSKPMLAYIPKAALDAEGEAFNYGAKKYDSWNYKNGIAVTRTISAALRHISQFLDGEDIDLESGVKHLGCARANLAIALDTLENHPELDNRYKKGKK